MNKQRALAFGSVLVLIAALVLSIIKSPTLMKMKGYLIYPDKINQMVAFEYYVYENGTINYIIYRHKPKEEAIDTTNIKIPLIKHFIDTQFNMTAIHGEYVCNEREFQEIKEVMENLDRDEDLVVSKVDPDTNDGCYIDVTYKGNKRTYPSAADYWTTYLDLEWKLMLLCPLDLPEVKASQLPPFVMH